ncbi:PREDICTED: uncharacterized protein LOC109647932%2C partial [Xyrichtys novacula]|uniref:PREDICTED: uncharacterized protein LOC109647932, partial n=1 Tax=Xyrichtys novacula TaxID=13765 RepID=A0AAV1HIY2_XYRNO|nr:PREDICTED: uncharacterized protein LOC109647932%2C partial [Xyrichtys novacula]
MFDLPINRSMDNIHKIGVSPSLRANELYKADPMNMFDMNDKELLRPRTPTPPGSPDSVRYSTSGKTNNKELLELFKLQMATTEEATRRLEEAAIQREQLQAKMQMERERLQAEQQVVLARQQAETIAALARQQAELQAERERRQAERESAHTQALVALAKQNDEAARQTIQLLTEAYQSQSARPSARSSRQSSRRESRQHSPARLSQAVYGTKAEPIEVAIQLSNKLQALDDEMRDHAKFPAPHISSAYQGDRKPIYSIPAQLSQPPPPLDGHGTVTPPPAASSQPQPSLQNHGPSNQEMRDIEKLPPVKDDRTLDDLSVRVQSLVGMLQSQQEKGNHELHASSNVERILDKLPKFRQERFRRQRNYLHAPQHELSLMDLSTFLRMEVRSLRLDPSLRGGPTPGDVGKKSRANPYSCGPDFLRRPEEDWPLPPSIAENPDEAELKRSPFCGLCQVPPADGPCLDDTSINWPQFKDFSSPPPPLDHIFTPSPRTAPIHLPWTPEHIIPQHRDLSTDLHPGCIRILTSSFELQPRATLVPLVRVHSIFVHSKGRQGAVASALLLTVSVVGVSESNMEETESVRGVLDTFTPSPQTGQKQDVGTVTMTTYKHRLDAGGHRTAEGKGTF